MGDVVPLHPPVRVLVVDDDELLADVVARTLELEGFEPVVAQGAVDALMRASADDRLAVLLSDVEMPDLHGTTLAECVRCVAPHLRIVLMSGDPGSLVAAACLADAVLPKPFTGQALRDAVTPKPKAQPVGRRKTA